MYISELETYFLDLGEKKFRAKQLFEAIHKQKIKNLDKLTTFSQDLKDKINTITPRKNQNNNLYYKGVMK